MTYQQIQQIKNKLSTYCFADCKKETCLKCLIKECIIDLEKEGKEEKIKYLKHKKEMYEEKIISDIISRKIKGRKK